MVAYKVNGRSLEPLVWLTGNHTRGSAWRWCMTGLMSRNDRVPVRGLVGACRRISGGFTAPPSVSEPQAALGSAHRGHTPALTCTHRYK